MPAVFDHDWRNRAIAGEPEAITLLADEMLEPLYRFCLYRVGKNHHLCEDAVQETLLRAIRQLRQYDPDRAGGDIFNWLAGLARNEIRRLLSHRSVGLQGLWACVDQDLLELYSRLETQTFQQELFQADQTRDMVNLTMSQLPPHYGSALEAKYVSGKSVREIALRLRMSEKAVESLLSRARQAFKETFTSLARHLPEFEGNL